MKDRKREIAERLVKAFNEAGEAWWKDRDRIMDLEERDPDQVTGDDYLIGAMLYKNKLGLYKIAAETLDRFGIPFTADEYRIKIEEDPD